MRFEDITVKFIEGTERPYEKKPELNIYEIDAENLEEMELCPCGAHLKKKSKGTRIVFDYRPSPFTSEEHVYRIHLKSQRYVCTNPNCRRSFTAGLLDRSKSSLAFSKLLVQKLLDKEHLSYTKVGEEFDVSHTFISKAVMDFISDVNLNFSPSRFCKYLYLHEFIYQQKPRYCLISVNTLNEHHIVGFFGYEDHKKELADYLRFHLKDEETWFTIATENAEEFADNFEQFPGQIFFVETQAGRDKKLSDEYEYTLNKNGLKEWNSRYCEVLKQIKKKLNGPDAKRQLKRWWETPIFYEEAKPHFEKLVTELLSDGSNYISEYGIYTVTFKEYEGLVNDYNQRNMPFEKMCLHMMHREYKKHKKQFLSEKDKGNMLYDEQNDVLYRPAPLEDVEKLKENARKIYEQYSIDEENYDPYDYWEPENFIHSEPDEELPESLIQRMAEYSIAEKIPSSYDDIYCPTDEESLPQTNE